MRTKKTAVPTTSGRKKITLGDAIAMFLSQHRATSAASYGANLKIIAKLIGPTKDIRVISHEHIMEIQRYISSPQKGYADATRTKYVKTLKTFFNWLVKNNFLTESPADFLRVMKVNPYIDPEKAMTDEELEKLLDYVKWRARDLALVLFLADTGARAGGAAGLKWRDLDFEGLRGVVTEKGDKTRPVAFGEVCLTALKRWQQRTPESAGEYVFSPLATPMTSASISQVITRACVCAGIRPLGSHSLRHRKGHQFADSRIAPTMAALALGHSDVRVTLESYYSQGWAKTDEALRELVVRSISTPGATPPTLPQGSPAAQTEKADTPLKGKIIALKQPS